MNRSTPPNLLATPNPGPPSAQSARTDRGPGQVGGPERFYRPELDTLRFIAFGGVFIHHSLPNQAEWWTARIGSAGPSAAALIRAGSFGVDLFFVLSAYLISELLLREWEQTGRIRVGAFLARRALRIWPLYFLFLLLAWLSDSWLGKQSFGSIEAICYVLFVGNWYAAFHGYVASVAAPLWSVSIEEQFYIAWPFILARGGPRILPGLVASMVVVALIARIGLTAAHIPHPVIWTSTLTRLDTIATGVFLAVLARRKPLPVFPLLPVALATMAVGCFVSALFAYPLISLSSAALLLAFRGTNDQTGIGRLLRRPELVAGGRISYGLYVFHVLGLAMAGHAVVAALPLRLSFLIPAVGLLFTIVLASISYRLIERPFLRLKAKLAVIPSRAT